MNWTDADIVQSILKGDEAGLVYLYKSHRAEFLGWASKRFQVDADLVSDAFQDAIMALRFNVVHGKVDGISSTLKTYLFAIGKNQLLNRLKKSKYEFSAEETILLERLVSTIEPVQELTDRQLKVKMFVQQIEEPCRSILRMFYYLGYSMDVIASRLDYKSEDVAKTIKSRCIRKLRSALSI
ncbi:MAG: sigma-70 family RNA polymerase sigma factor [Saprospiraceae bacterium]|nr:sigma-70 family RNA polymerase sigma factor [Saprospiraceae bacterium]